MNKFTIFITFILATSVFSAPNPLRSLPALTHEHFHDKFGQYALRYVTAEGTVVSEIGKLVPNTKGAGHVMEVEGEVTYMGEDGKSYVTKYTAGVNGVKMEGDHLPVAPIAAPVDFDVADVVSKVMVPVVSEVNPVVSDTVAPVVPKIIAPVVPEVSRVDSEKSAGVVSIPDAPSLPPMTTADA